MPSFVQELSPFSFLHRELYAFLLSVSQTTKVIEITNVLNLNFCDFCGILAANILYTAKSVHKDPSKEKVCNVLI